MNAGRNCEALFNATMPFAERMLQQYGEFYPFGAAMTATGEVISVNGYTGSDMPPSADLIALLKDGFVHNAASGEYIATALVYDVRITLPPNDSKSDAIAVSLDHRDDYSIVLLYPYRLDNGQLTIDDCITKPGASSIFP